MKKILIPVATLGNWGETNGIVTLFENLLSFFKDSEFKVDIVTYGPKQEKRVKENVTIITHKPQLPFRVDPNIFVDPFFSVSETARKLRHKDYDLVHSWTPGPLGWFGIEVAKFQDCPFISVHHTTLDHTIKDRVGVVAGDYIADKSGKAIKEIMTLYYNRSDLILVPSAYTKKEAVNSYKPPVKILSRGVDSKFFDPAKRKRKNKEVIGVYVSRVAPEKNLQLLVKTVNKLGIKLKVVGHGPSLEQLKEDIPSAKFTNKLVGEKLARAYADADYFVFPSLTETFGQVIQEAMASGLPVVVMNSMAAPEIVQHGKTGFIADNENEFIKYVKMLNDNKVMREKMGKDARDFAEKRTWKKIFEQLVRYYDSML